MSVKIPIYQDRLTPNGFGVVPHAANVEFTDAVGRGMQNLGNAGVTAASHEMHLLKQKEDADAVANLAAPLAQADLTTKDWLTSASKNASDGGNLKQEDGTLTPIRDAAEKYYDDWSKSFLAGITNEKAKRVAMQHIATSRTTFLSGAMTTQATADYQNRSDKVDQATSSWTKLAQENDGVAPELVQAAKTMIANSGFDQHTRNLKAIAAEKSIVEAALTGYLHRNPEGAKDAFLARFGMTAEDLSKPVAQAGGTATQPGQQRSYANLSSENAGLIAQSAEKLGISAQDLTAIISYETGGSFSPGKWGGKNGQHVGLIQFGAEEQKAYGANDKQTFAEQMGAVERYLTARGVKPGDDLKTLYKIVNGGNRNVSDNASDGNGTIAQHVARMQQSHGGGDVVSTATGAPGVPTAPRPPVPAHIASLVGMLEPTRVTAFLNEATTVGTKNQMLVRSQVATAENNQTAAAMNGQMPQNPLQESDYVRAYGPVEGRQRFGQFQQNMTMGSDLNAMRLQTPDQIEATVARYKPVNPDGADYDLATKRYSAVVAAAQQIRAAREADPISYAQINRVGNVQPIDWNKSDAAISELSNRVGVADTMTRTFNAPYALLSKDEASKLAQGLNNMSAPQKLAYLGTIAKAVPNIDAYQSIMNMIVPDSPVSALAGRLVIMDQSNVVQHGMWWWKSDVQYNPQQVASLIMRGEELLNPNKAAKSKDGKAPNNLMFKEEDVQSLFNELVGTSFTGQQRDGYSMAYQATKAYYAARMEGLSDYSGTKNDKVFREAVEAVTGGATDINGKGKVRRPWGMQEGTFVDSAKAAFDSKMAELGRTGPTNNFRLFGLENYGDAYRVREGTGYMLDKSGNQVVIDVTGKVAPQVRPTDVRQPVGAMGKPITQTPNTK